MEDIQRILELGTQGTTVTWIEPTATDISGIISLTSRSHSPGDLFIAEKTTVIYLFTDGAGNSAICTFCIAVIYGKCLLHL